MTEYSIEIAVAMVVALTQVIKMTGFPSRFLPLLTVVLGSLLAAYLKLDPMNGLIIGLTATGLYSGVKNTLGK